MSTTEELPAVLTLGTPEHLAEVNAALQRSYDCVRWLAIVRTMALHAAVTYDARLNLHMLAAAHAMTELVLANEPITIEAVAEQMAWRDDLSETRIIAALEPLKHVMPPLLDEDWQPLWECVE